MKRTTSTASSVGRRSSNAPSALVIVPRYVPSIWMEAPGSASSVDWSNTTPLTNRSVVCCPRTLAADTRNNPRTRTDRRANISAFEGIGYDIPSNGGLTAWLPPSYSLRRSSWLIKLTCKYRETCTQSKPGNGITRKMNAVPDPRHGYGGSPEGASCTNDGV